MRSHLSFILSTIFISTSYAQTNVIDGHEYVDMGLPSGTLWATCNIGAESSTDFGDYFAWGETEPKEEYTNETFAQRLVCILFVNSLYNRKLFRIFEH